MIKYALSHTFEQVSYWVMEPITKSYADLMINEVMYMQSGTALREFIERNTNNCLITNKFVLDFLEDRSPHCYHGYFYVKDEKFLTPI